MFSISTQTVLAPISLYRRPARMRPATRASGTYGAKRCSGRPAPGKRDDRSELPPQAPQEAGNNRIYAGHHYFHHIALVTAPGKQPDPSSHPVADGSRSSEPGGASSSDASISFASPTRCGSARRRAEITCPINAPVIGQDSPAERADRMYQFQGSRQLWQAPPASQRDPARNVPQARLPGGRTRAPAHTTRSPALSRSSGQTRFSDAARSTLGLAVKGELRSYI